MRTIAICRGAVFGSSGMPPTREPADKTTTHYPGTRGWYSLPLICHVSLVSCLFVGLVLLDLVSCVLFAVLHMLSLLGSVAYYSRKGGTVIRVCGQGFLILPQNLVCRSILFCGLRVAGHNSLNAPKCTKYLQVLCCCTVWGHLFVLYFDLMITPSLD